MSDLYSKEKETSKYDYIPDVSLIMEQVGAKMNLLDILNEKPLRTSKTDNRFDSFYYSANDINGRFV